MSEARKNAFRRILYAAMLDFRMEIPETPMLWAMPWRWPRVLRRLRQIRATAEWLHNLAQFASSDFAGFEDDPFWREYDRLARRYSAAAFGLYRVFFENFDASVEGVPVGKWGTADEA